MTELLQSNPDDVTILLNTLSDGDEKVVDQLLPILYNDLQKMAKRQQRLKNY